MFYYIKIFTFKYDDISKNYITHFGKKAKKILNKLQLLSGVFGVCVCVCMFESFQKGEKNSLRCICLDFVTIITESFKMSKQLRPDQSIQRKTNYHLKIIWLVSEIADCNI